MSYYEGHLARDVPPTLRLFAERIYNAKDSFVVFTPHDVRNRYFLFSYSFMFSLSMFDGVS